MPYITTCTLCGKAYEETSEENAHAPDRECWDCSNAPFRPWRCHLRSRPGMWAQYDGHVDVTARRESDVFTAAVRHLARTSFPDRPSPSSWILERIEPLP